MGGFSQAAESGSVAESVAGSATMPSNPSTVLYIDIIDIDML